MARPARQNNRARCGRRTWQSEKDLLWRLLNHVRDKEDRDKFSLVCRAFRAACAPFRTTFLFDYAQLVPGLTRPERRPRPVVWDALPEQLMQCARHFPNFRSLTIKGTHLTSFGLVMPTIHISTVLSNGHLQRLTSLTISFVEDLNDRFVHELSCFCPALTHLSLSQCINLSDQALRFLAAGCPLLTSLHLCCFSKNSITDIGLDNLLQSCTSITELRLDGLELVTGWGFRACASTLRTLVVDLFDSLESNALTQGLQGNRLRSLSITWSSGEYGWQAAIAEICTKDLEELDLTGISMIDDALLDTIARKSRRLRVLKLESVDEVTAAGWGSLSRHAQALEILDVRETASFGELDLNSFVDCWPLLRHITLPRKGLWPATDDLVKFCDARPTVTVEIFDDMNDPNRCLFSRPGLAIPCPLQFPH